MIVIDASVIVAALLVEGAVGEWAAHAVADADLAAPSLAAFEAANIIRRHAAAGIVHPRIAESAHRDLALLTVEYWPYDSVAARCWELRQNLTIYDAAYVAVAEATGSPLYTLDQQLVSATGPACRFVTPA